MENVTMETQHGITFEQIKEMFAEIGRKQEEDRAQLKANEEYLTRLFAETDRRMQETDRQMRLAHEELDKRMKETDRQMQETDRRMRLTHEELDKRMQETDRRMKLTHEEIGRLTNRFGEIVESMIVPSLVNKFRELGFEFEKNHHDTEIIDLKHDIILEVDAFLENGDKVMIVEIKSKPKTDDINRHVEKMKKLRKYADFKNDKRAFLGAIAGVVFSDAAKEYALKKGFFVIEPSGDSFNITMPEGRYKVREW